MNLQPRLEHTYSHAQGDYIPTEVLRVAARIANRRALEVAFILTVLCRLGSC